MARRLRAPEVDVDWEQGLEATGQSRYVAGLDIVVVGFAERARALSLHIDY